MSHACSGGCTKGWSAGRKCHCSACGENFSTVGNFDQHFEKDKCLHPSVVGLVKNKRGVWITPGETDYDERFKRPA